MGEIPATFTVNGASYTPESYRDAQGIDLDDYIGFTSYTHHPFYTAFAIEVEDNWRWTPSWNVPLDEFMAIIDNAVDKGYTVAWGGDVSEEGFTRNGIAILVDNSVKPTSGSDQERWVGKGEDKPAEKPAARELEVTQELRQLMFDEKTSTDDHGMHLYGIAKDQNGNKFYLIKNSWGETGAYKGIWYMSENFAKAKTLNIVVNKKAVPKEILKKLGLK
jgi:aminopeptidase C